jgi:hypothetical protein
MEDEKCAQNFDEKMRRTDRVGNLGVNGGTYRYKAYGIIWQGIFNKILTDS